MDSDEIEMGSGKNETCEYQCVGVIEVENVLKEDIEEQDSKQDFFNNSHKNRFSQYLKYLQKGDLNRLFETCDTENLDDERVEHNKEKHTRMDELGDCQILNE